jgi:hypothetical protein
VLMARGRSKEPTHSTESLAEAKGIFCHPLTRSSGLVAPRFCSSLTSNPMPAH